MEAVIVQVKDERSFPCEIIFIIYSTCQTIGQPKLPKKMLPICKVWVVPSGSHASAFVKCICLKMQGQSIVLSFIFIQFIPVATNKTDLENNQNNSKDKKIHLVLFWLSLIRLYEQWSRLMAHV